MSSKREGHVFINQRERKNNRLSMRVSESEMNLLNQLSYKNDEPVSQIIRKAIKAYVNSSQDK